MIELPISESDAYAISKSQLELDSLLTLESGRNQLRDEIIFDIWKDFFKVLQKYRSVILRIHKPYGNFMLESTFLTTLKEN